MNIPHQSTILIRINAEIMERTPEGKVTGIPVSKQNDSLLLTVIGSSKEDCEAETAELITQIKQRILNG